MYKKSYKKRVYKKKPSQYKSGYSMSKRINYIASVVKPEKKFKDFTDVGFNIGTTAIVNHLSNVDGGSAIDQRVGNKLSPRYLFGRFEFVSDPTPPATFMRIIVFQDLQQVLSTTPGAISLLQSTDTRSPLNVQNKGRFKILRDELFALNNSTMNVKVLKINIRLDGTMQYSNNTGTNIQQNGLYILFLSSEGTNPPLGSYFLRLSWTD